MKNILNLKNLYTGNIKNPTIKDETIKIDIVNLQTKKIVEIPVKIITENPEKTDLVFIKDFLLFNLLKNV